ncbi:hypothetical protein Hoch_0752 [Haliangium ochraceum DSM 14365]|uniref:Uncharacterized protein n=1 Tax=Haliangium ochraceum (strain DSM 14365 / JCM 11303 / SMP-2) TaxID=502025 RepID=D0LN02_HALO1|nr:hypothetical protein Hoch_0752 [Haliangium ochraceum DSM 14365]
MKGENTGAEAEADASVVTEATGQGGNASAPAETAAEAAHIETTSVRTENGAIVVTGRLFRHGGGNGRPHRFTGQPAPSAPPPARRPARVAQMLAFAHRVDGEVERGEFESRSMAARHYGMTTGRITQFLSLLWLSPEIQEDVLFIEAVDGCEPVSGQAAWLLASDTSSPTSAPSRSSAASVSAVSSASIIACLLIALDQVFGQYGLRFTVPVAPHAPNRVPQ